ncbi:hypothetical protein [Metabacillus fastidiosus]|uniref:hypothetical protein n=1 Tax=Metabacillus fastidiosus TaxID=1458 RepID=UPI003D2D0DB3
MKLTFWRLLGSQLVRVHSLYGVIASIVLSVTLWVNTPDKNISLIYFLIMSIMSILIIITLISALLIALNNQSLIPKIENVIRTKKEEVICLLEKSTLFSHGISVSFYYTDEHNFEQLICIGTVINIQENGIIQVKIEDYFDVHEDIIVKLKNNEKHLVEKVTVKPTVPYQY